MNDKISRIALVLVALAGSAFLAKDCGEGGNDGTVPPPTGPTDVETGAETVDPLAGQNVEVVADSTPIKPAKAVEPPVKMKRRDVGPPLDDGEIVDLAFRYKEGVKARYRLENASRQVNRDNNLTVYQHRWDDITTEVISVGDDGSARVRIEIDAIRMRGYYPNGLTFEFDSRSPDATLLEDENLALAIKPALALIGLPLEFDLASNGAPIEVEGLQNWRDAWEDAVEREAPGMSRDMATPFSRDTILLEWREVLFPGVIGEPLAAGEERTLELLRDTMQKAYAKFVGPMQATHDDGEVFRVRMVATPDKEPRTGEPRSAQERAIAATHIQASKDAYYAAWRFNREAGRLEDAEIETEYQLWVSWPVGSADPGIATARDRGGGDYQPVFLTIERQTRLELLSDESDAE